MTGFDRQESINAVELQGAIEDLLASVYPKLSFIELSRLFNCLVDAGIAFNAEKFFGNWSYSYNENLLLIIQLLRTLPEKFLDYAARKDLSPRDLEPLNLKQEMDKELIGISECGASRSEAALLIELISDLKMLKKSPANIDWTQRAADTIDQLKICRFPKRYGLAKEARKRAKKLSWPKSVRWKWNTRSDQNTLDLQLSLKSLQDLQAFSERFKMVSEQAQAEENNPWQ